MSGRSSKIKKRLLIGLAVTGVVAALAVGSLYALLKLSVTPLVDGTELSDGAVRVVVTDHVGPFRIAAYLLTLEDGGVALVDTGMDPEASAIRSALAATGRTTADVRAIFLTHFHDDHRGGAPLFRHADLYVPAQYARLIGERRAAAGATGHVQGFEDGERLTVAGTTVELFALPGHTEDSVAVLAHGVLFLGDSAASLHDGTMYPNTILSDDPARTVESLSALAERLAPRADAIRHLAFGHHGALDGLQPLLDWAAAHKK